MRASIRISRPCGPPFGKVGHTGLHSEKLAARASIRTHRFFKSRPYGPPFGISIRTYHALTGHKNVVVHFIFVFGRSEVILDHFVKKKLTEIIFWVSA